MKCQAKVIINAPAKDVFRVLSDLSFYAQFDPRCRKVCGVFEEGNSVKIYYNDDEIEQFKVHRITKGQMVVLRHALPLDLFVNTRTISIIAKDDATTELCRTDEATGLLLSFFPKKIHSRERLREFCLCVKQFIEARP